MSFFRFQSKFNISSTIQVKPRQVQPYHQVDNSPWPILMAIALQGFATTFVSYQKHNDVIFIPSILTIAIVTILWWRDVIRESLGGYHTSKVKRGIYLGFLLFLLSEIMLFASFFWAFFHSSLAPAIDIGATWPPVGIKTVNTWAIPLQGSCVLQASGFVQTQGHHAIVAGNKDQALVSFLITVIMGILFIFLQYNEYTYGEFTISDGAYGSVFYCTTGLHAIHVIVGVIFQGVGLIRIFFDQITTEHHLGVEFSIYYWHQVDVVWLQVFTIYYFWGSLYF